MSDINKGFYAIIPANVRYDSKIPPNAKLFYSEITALCNEKGYCWANNEYFTELYDTTDRTIRRWLNILSVSGYIKVEYQYKPGTKEILKRYIKLADSSTLAGEKILTLGADKNVPTCGQKCPIGADKNVRENNIINNNNILKTYCPSDEGQKELPPTKDTYENITDLYSKVCLKLPKVVKITDSRKKSIKKLLEMYTVEQIETAFKNINDSNFCTGNNERGWKADFDFCINSNKVTNALEGKYKNSFDNKINQSYQQNKSKPANKFHNFTQSDNYSESEMEALAEKRKEKLFKDIAQRSEKTGA
ncbi:MAG: helix-turn-helix domain-containing protein [Sedimentibacter sp.]|uniref:helix-turn-helix domain-containing protein n=1 Tax=Sedimentibacter sp. TaxID=1960295 RepID=UPI0029818DC3|nr:helix-turn-helix domain-containing protein [Sedimentibacter sp.]MDW5300225.1 helix-turn-helix domain-containing protein [Sedimentibacter sp.]